MKKQEPYWSFRTPPTPELSDLPPGVFAGDERAWSSLSPGYRRTIWLEALKNPIQIGDKTMEITREIASKVLQTVDAGLVRGLGRPVPGQMCVEAAVCYAMGLPHSDEPICVAPILRSFKIRLNDSTWSSNEARAAGLRRLALVQLGSKNNLDEKEFSRRLVDLAIRKQVPIALRAAASVHEDSNHRVALLAAADRCEKEGNKDAALNAKKVAVASAASAYAASAAADHAVASAYAASAAASAYAASVASAYAASAYADHAVASAYAAAAAASAYAASAALAAVASAYAADHAYAGLKARDKVMSAFAEDVVQILVEMNVPGAQWLDLAPNRGLNL